MENIPHTYYDAAKVDGANAWQQFRSITVPLLWDVITMAVVFLIIGGLRIFDLIYVMALGYPNEQSQVIATYLYEQAFNNAHMGYGIAIAVVLFVLVFSATAVAMRVMRREQLEY
jgi:raffinose/stachyose/melibiose transport system permease protein